MKRSTRWMTLVVVFALVFSACGSKASPSPSAAAPSTEVSPSPEPSQTPVPSPVFTGPPVTLKWFCCLGGGDDPSTDKVFKQVIKDFNASQTHIKLVYDHTAYSGARAQFSTELASGNPPDFVGPLGVGGANAFEGQWLDLNPYIQKEHVDLSGYDQGVLDLYKAGGGEQFGIPFAIYPSELYYQPDMFDEAGLEYPPAKYGEQYKMPDGSMVDWNYDTVRQIAMKLTVDKAGKDATEAGFDPKHIVQYGFEPQRDDLRTDGAQFFGAGKLVGDDGKTVQIPDPWVAAWKWVYDGTWKDHFIETNSVYQSPEFNGGYSTFNSGKVAMNANFLWNLCCITDAGSNWQIAALPSYNGKVTVPMNADTFRITKGTKHPDEAWYVLKYMIMGPAHTKLLNSISGFPALKAEQAGFFSQLEQQKTDKGKPVYPKGLNFSIVTDGIQYADINPNSENAMPKYNKSLDTLTKYLTRWTSTGGLNMDSEITKLKTELQAVWNASS